MKYITTIFLLIFLSACTSPQTSQNPISADQDENEICNASCQNEACSNPECSKLFCSCDECGEEVEKCE